MIRARVGRFALTVRGHAGSGDPGHDLICAGVSALVLALREELLWLESRKALRFETLQLEPGLALVRCTPAPGREGQLEPVFDTVVRGLALLERLFGAYVHLEREENIHNGPEVREYKGGSDG